MNKFNAATISGSTRGVNNLQVIFVERPGKTLALNLAPEAQNRLVLALLAEAPSGTSAADLPPSRTLVIHGTAQSRFHTNHPLAKNHACLDIELGQSMNLRLAIPAHQLAKFQQEVAALKPPPQQPH